VRRARDRRRDGRGGVWIDADMDRPAPLARRLLSQRA
jgi:hypothetical protein